MLRTFKLQFSAVVCGGWLRRRILARRYDVRAVWAEGRGVHKAQMAHQAAQLRASDGGHGQQPTQSLFSTTQYSSIANVSLLWKSCHARHCPRCILVSLRQRVSKPPKIPGQVFDSLSSEKAQCNKQYEMSPKRPRGLPRPVVASQIFAVASQLPVTTNAPSGLKAAAVTGRLCWRSPVNSGDPAASAPNAATASMATSTPTKGGSAAGSLSSRASVLYQIGYPVAYRSSTRFLNLQYNFRRLVAALTCRSAALRWPRN